MAFLAFTMALLAVRLLFVPLAIVFEFRARQRDRSGLETPLDRVPTVSVVVPAYNEEKVLRSCVGSILGTNYPNLEIVIVDDGSTDATRTIGEELAEQNDQVSYIHQKNAGKGAALNRGYRESTGEFLLFIDADSVLTVDTIPAMLRAFYRTDIGAVCGDDRPVNLNKLLTRFLALITHVGTGLVRRAFDVVGVVPVISGNSGAFRRSCLDDVAKHTVGRPLREDTVGEDLELTWHIHTSRWRVVFEPRALVYAESPSSLRALYKQRTRWARGLLQSLRIYRGHLIRLDPPAFSGLLWFTLVTMVLTPLIQIVLFIVFLVRLPTYNFTALGFIFGNGLAISTFLLVIATAMSRSMNDLRHIWALPFWPVYSMAMSLSMLGALRQEALQTELKWNKPERTGVISREDRLAIERGLDRVDPRATNHRFGKKRYGKHAATQASFFDGRDRIRIRPIRRSKLGRHSKQTR